MEVRSIIAVASASSGVTFCTTAPYRLGSVWVGRIGFANIPVVGCYVYHKYRDAMGPIVRQHVFRILREQGLPYRPQVVKQSPTVGERRQRMVVDTNPNSASRGNRKRLVESEWTFEILDIKTFGQCLDGRFPVWRETIWRAAE